MTQFNWYKLAKLESEKVPRFSTTQQQPKNTLHVPHKYAITSQYNAINQQSDIDN